MKNGPFLKDSKYLGRDTAALRLNIVKAKDSLLYDADGREYIDFLMGWCVGNIGWGNKTIEKRLRNFSGPNYVNPMYTYERWNDLAELLAKITPDGLTKTFRATGGTEAVEIAIQTAMRYTGRHKFISIEGSYHGHSIGAMSVGASYFKEWYPKSLFSCTRVSPPLDAKTARKIEKNLSRENVAAVILEPIICNLGVVIPTRDFMTILSKACKKYGTLLIIDEVATGFGRTGSLFGINNFPDVTPDIMTFAKGITGGYGALGATIMSEKLAKAMEFEFSFYSTFGWHPLAVEGALANINYIIDNQDALFKNSNFASEYIHKRLSNIKFKHEVTIRIQGLAIGLECPDPTYFGKIFKKCEKKGLLFCLIDPSLITMFPALTIDSTTLKRAMDTFESSV